MFSDEITSKTLRKRVDEEKIGKSLAPGRISQETTFDGKSMACSRVLGKRIV